MAEKKSTKSTKAKKAAPKTTKATTAKATAKAAPKVEKAARVPNVMMRPALLVLHHVVLGVVLGWLIPWEFGKGWGILGLLLLWISYGLNGWAKKVLEGAKTPVPVNEPTTKIVENGPFSFTRNPMYLGVLVGFVGLSMLVGSVPMALLAVPLYYFLDRRIVAAEEIYLEEKFGKTYLDYKSKTSRWLI